MRESTNFYSFTIEAPPHAIHLWWGRGSFLGIVGDSTTTHGGRDEDKICGFLENQFGDFLGFGLLL